MKQGIAKENNVEKSVPRLTFGTLLTLLYCARKGPLVRTNQGLFILDLMRIVTPKYHDPGEGTRKPESSLWMNCKKRDSEWIPLGRDSFIRSVNEAFEQDFSGIIVRTAAFLDKHYDKSDTFRLKRAAKAILDVLDKDLTIGKTEALRIQSQGEFVRKDALKTIKSIKYEHLLAGVLLYVLTDRGTDNKDGDTTIAKWRPDFTEVNNTCYFYNFEEADWLSQIDFDFSDAEESNPAPVEEPNRKPTDTEITEYIEFIKEKYGEVTPIFQERPRPFYSQYVNSSISVGNGSVIVDNPTANRIRDQVSNLVIVVGDGGIGKTMMMQHLAYDSASNFQDGSLVPFVAKLKDYNSGAKDILTFLHDAVSSSFPGMTLERIKDLLSKGSALLLFDGLDEIDPKYLPLFKRNLESFIDQNPGNVCIMSSRGYGSFGVYNGFTVAKLCPLSLEQAIELVEKIAPFESVKNRLIDELKRGLFAKQKQLTSNPMMLTVLMRTFKDYPNVPVKLHSFFSKVYETLSAKHDADKDLYKRKLQTNLNPDEFRELLTRFCTKLYFQNAKSFTREQGIQFFNEIKGIVGMDSVKASDFLSDLEVSFCMVGQDSKGYFFRNEAFMEYFVACQLMRYGEKQLAPVVDFLQKSKEPLDGDKTLEMLFDMNKIGVEENLFHPFLKRIFDECDADDDPFMTFLSLTYPKIRFSVGECPQYAYSISPSFVYNTIRTIAGLDRFPELEVLSEDGLAGFSVDEHYWVPKADGGFISKSQICNIDEFPTEERPSPVGWDIEIEVKDLVTQPDRFESVIDELVYEESDFYKEYLAIRRYFEEVGKRKEAKPVGLDALLY